MDPFDRTFGSAAAPHKAMAKGLEVLEHREAPLEGSKLGSGTEVQL